VSIGQGLSKHSSVGFVLNNKRALESVRALWREADVDVTLSYLPTLELAVSYWKEAIKKIHVSLCVTILNLFVLFWRVLPLLSAGM